jgi:hypothetical protein
MIPREKNQLDGNKSFLMILLEPLSTEKVQLMNNNNQKLN